LCPISYDECINLCSAETSPPSHIQSSCFTACANSPTCFTVFTLSVTTFPTYRTIYSSSSSRLGSLPMPLRASVLTWYWSITHSRADRLPNLYWKHSGGIPHRRGLKASSQQPRGKSAHQAKRVAR